MLAIQQQPGLPQTKPQTKRLSSSWILSKLKNAPDDVPRRRVSELDHPQILPPAQEQNSRFLALPLEIQHRVFDFLTTPWTMAILSVDELTDHHLDDTYFCKKSGSKVLSGPPNFELLLVSRAMYQNFYRRYGDGFTGKLVVSRFRNLTRRDLRASLRLLSTKRFCTRIESLSLTFAVAFSSFRVDFRKLFPNVRYADCLVYEGMYGPMMGFNDDIGMFLRGHYDRHVLDTTMPTVNHYLAGEGRSVAAVYSNSKPWDDEKATVNVKVLGTSAKWPGAIVAFNYRWEGDKVRILSRVFWDGLLLRYWEEGVQVGSIRRVEARSAAAHAMPEKYRWVIPPKKFKSNGFA